MQFVQKPDHLRQNLVPVQPRAQLEAALSDEAQKLSARGQEIVLDNEVGEVCPQESWVRGRLAQQLEALIEEREEKRAPGAQ